MQRVDVKKKGSGKKRKRTKKEEKYDETVRGLLNEREVSVRRRIDRMHDTICMTTDESVSPLIGVSSGIVALIFTLSSVELII